MSWGPTNWLKPAAFAGAQALAGTAVLLGLAFAPPVQGRMLLVPLTASGARALVAVARRHDALLLGSGPLAGSLVVDARRDGLAAAAFDNGVIALAAPAVLCGNLPFAGAEK